MEFSRTMKSPLLYEGGLIGKAVAYSFSSRVTSTSKVV